MKFDLNQIDTQSSFSDSFAAMTQTKHLKYFISSNNAYLHVCEYYKRLFMTSIGHGSKVTYLNSHGCSLKISIGCSIFLYSCLPHAMRPENIGMLRAVHGSSLCFSYITLMC